MTQAVGMKAHLLALSDQYFLSYRKKTIGIGLRQKQSC